MTGDAPPLPVFVYGLLRPGQSGFIELGLEGRVDLLGPARVAGTLFDLGDYPGIVLDGNGWVAGELIRPRDDAVWSLLDAYELYDSDDPDASEYLRLQTVTRDNLTVWIYAYNCPIGDASPLAEGDWIARR